MTDRVPLTEEEIRIKLGIASHVAWTTLRACGVPASSITLTSDLSNGRQISVEHRPKEESGS